MEYSKEDLKLLQLCEELILKEVDRICIENGIDYFIGGGTAIGQKRHGGFIPWDDDIDINMSRSDYNKFISIAYAKLPEYLFLQNHITDKNFSKLYSKVRLKDTKFIEYQYRNSKIEQGIYIDVFPMDSCVNDLQYLKKMNKRAIILYSLYDYRVNPVSNQPISSFFDRIKNVVKYMLHFCLCILPKSFYSNAYYRFIKKHEIDSEYIADFGTAGGKGFIINKNFVFPTKRNSFDLIEVNTPSNIDEFLKIRYGDDYMSLPPIEQRVNHSPYVLDFGEYSFERVMDMINE